MTDELTTDTASLNQETSSLSDNTAGDTFAEEHNKEAFDLLLQKIRDSVITKRDYGTKFETLVRSWLTRDEAYRDLFSKVMTYADWAREHPDLTINARDIGIDLVGVNAEDHNTFTAIQCKMYEEKPGAQCFPRYLYISDNFGPEKADAISDPGLRHFQEAYGSAGAGITKDDVFYYVYGILHSPDYRARYANNLGKEVPRIPRVTSYQDFRAFADAGRKLADLHVNYEMLPEYPGVTITGEDTRNYTVSKMQWAKIPGKKGNDAKDKTKLLFNSAITVSNIPLEAQEYVVNKKSALDWVVEKAEIDKENGIVNDFNTFANDPRYPLALFLKVITVSMETVKIVKALPPLKIHPLDEK